MINYLSLGILVLIFGASFFLRRRSFWPGFCRNVFFVSLFLVFLVSFYQASAQYKYWSGNEISKFLLPPYQGIGYFVFYAGFEFFASYTLALFFAVLFLFFSRKLNRKGEERFFYPEEHYFGAMAIFLSGHPGWLFYLIFLTTVYFLLHIYSSLVIRKASYRLSLYYLWIPVGIFVIMISKWIQFSALWQILKI